MSKCEEQLKQLNKIGAKSWLIANCKVLEYDASLRDSRGRPLNGVPGKPMNRFVFQVDGFTTIDAEIAENEQYFQILSNRCLDLSYPEDSAFCNEQFVPGMLVNWELFAKHLREWVELSNQRVGIS